MCKASEVLALKSRIEQSRRLASTICNLKAEQALIKLADEYNVKLDALLIRPHFD